MPNESPLLPGPPPNEQMSEEFMRGCFRKIKDWIVEGREDVALDLFRDYTARIVNTQGEMITQSIIDDLREVGKYEILPRQLDKIIRKYVNIRDTCVNNLRVLGE